MKFNHLYYFFIYSWITCYSPFVFSSERSNPPHSEIIEENNLSKKEVENPINECQVHESTQLDLESRLAELFSNLDAIYEQGLFDGEVLVTKKNEIVYHQFNPEISLEEPSQGPQFMIGSVSKQFFAVALLKSLYDDSPAEHEKDKIEEVKTKLQEPIAYYLPEDHSIWNGFMPDWTKEVTLHHLLSHTSGVSNYTECRDYSLYHDRQYWFESFRSPYEIIDIILEKPLEFTPGSKFSYSNTNYVLIAEIIESITQQPAAEYLQTTLFEPLELSSTACPLQGTWIDLQQEPSLTRLVSPFKYDPQSPYDVYTDEHCEDISVAKGSGSIISTSSDLMKWNQALHKNQSVLPQELYQLMINENINNYGYGIGVSQGEEGMILDHQGLIGSYQTLLLYMPKYDVSLIILSNVSYDFNAVEDEFNKLIDELQNTIPNEQERIIEADRMIFKKYPQARGFEKIFEQVIQVFSH